MTTFARSLPLDTTKRFLAAYEVGRLLNEASWHLAHATYCQCVESRTWLRSRLHELAVKARGLAPTTRSDELENQIRRIADDAVEYLTSEHFADSHCDATCRLLQRELHGVPNTYETAEARRELRIDTVGVARSVLVTVLERTTYSFVALGERIDQGVRPPNVEEHLYRVTTIDTDSGLAFYDPNRLRSDGSPDPWHVDNRLLGNTLIKAGDIPPDPNWGCAVGLLWNETGLLGEIPADADELDRNNQLLRGKGEKPASGERCVEILDSAVRNHLEPIVKYLGVQVDEATHQVSRDDHAAVVTITSEPAWGLLKLLIRNGSTPTGKEAYRTWYSNKGRSADGSDAALANAATHLRKVLEPLGLCVENKPSIGYLLIDVSNFSVRHGAKKRKPRK